MNTLTIAAAALPAAVDVQAPSGVAYLKIIGFFVVLVAIGIAWGAIGTTRFQNKGETGKAKDSAVVSVIAIVQIAIALSAIALVGWFTGILDFFTTGA